MPVLHPTDEELLSSMRAGDEEALAALYRRRRGGVYRFALQMSGSSEMADDVTQEVFLTLIREAHRFDPSRGSLAAFLYGIARNHLLRLLEKSRHFVPLADEADEDEAPAGPARAAETDLVSELVKGELVERLRLAILALPTHYREAVILCELHEMSYAEAAAVLNCAVGTVRSRLHRARALLTERLRPATAPGESQPDLPSVRCFA